MNIRDQKIGVIVGALAAITWLFSVYSAVREARWFMSNDSVFEIMGVPGLLAGIAAGAMVYISLQEGTRQRWMLYGICAVVAFVIKLSESTYLGFARGLDLNGVIFLIGIVVAFFGYQQASE